MASYFVCVRPDTLCRPSSAFYHLHPNGVCKLLPAHAKNEHVCCSAAGSPMHHGLLFCGRLSFTSAGVHHTPSLSLHCHFPHLVESSKQVRGHFSLMAHLQMSLCVAILSCTRTFLLCDTSVLPCIVGWASRVSQPHKQTVSWPRHTRLRFQYC